MTTSEYDDARRRHPSNQNRLTAAEKSTFDTLVASYRSGIVAKDPFAPTTAPTPQPTPTPNIPTAMSAVRVNGIGQFVLYLDGKPIALEETAARHLNHDLTNTIKQVDAERHKEARQ